AAQLTAAVLLAFSARRAVLLSAASLPGRAPDPAPPEPQLPLVEVLVPCHNEAASLPGLFSALEALDYPRQALRVTIVDDASTDVAGVSGQMRVNNGLESPAAAYSMIESAVNQFVTMRAKDRLNLAPALLGSNCAYRLAALREVSGFRGGALLEDSDLTLVLA